MALQKVVHILRNTRSISAVFTHTLPKGKKEVSGILVLEQQINLINEDEGISAFRPVLRNAV